MEMLGCERGRYHVPKVWNSMNKLYVPYMQLASYLEGGPLKWILSLNLHVNQKSDDDDDDQNFGFYFAGLLLF